MIYIYIYIYIYVLYIALYIIAWQCIICFLLGSFPMGHCFIIWLWVLAQIMALADAMEGLINDPRGCQVMGSAGRVLAEKTFDVKHVVTAHVQIYQELIGK